jgi:peptidoglycan/xylan/chitin deacetylase (PgdA/CDA1 family)
MNVLLTYHRVVGDRDPLPGFFSVRRSELDAQLRLATEIWEGRPGTLVCGQPRFNSRAPACLATFDDGTTGHYEHAAPALEACGMRGIFYVSTALLDRPGYLTREQCRDLIRRGHAIESHGHEHVPFPELDSGKLENALRRSRDILSEIGAGDLRSVAAVGGAIDTTVEKVARKVGFASMRSLRWGFNAKPSFLWESFNINRKLTPNRFRWLLSPRAIAVKRMLHFFKEQAKEQPFRGIYQKLQSHDGNE